MTIRDDKGENALPAAGVVHFWRIRLDGAIDSDVERQVLSADELDRADRYHFVRDRDRYIRSHFALRSILARYAGSNSGRLAFEIGEFGKPRLRTDEGVRPVEFNLSHSGDWAVIALAAQPVGVDVERWDAGVECLDLATHYFSPAERSDLGKLAAGTELMEGFFQAWSRKEAYLKATGSGISDGLHHFDVSIVPGEAAVLLADRLQPEAPSRWSMASMDVAEGYSAAVVVAGPLVRVELFDF